MAREAIVGFVGRDVRPRVLAEREEEVVHSRGDEVALQLLDVELLRLVPGEARPVVDKRADFAGHPIGLRRRRKFCGLVLLKVGTGERTPENLRDVGRRIVVELERLLDFLLASRIG